MMHQGGPHEGPYQGGQQCGRQEYQYAAGYAENPDPIPNNTSAQSKKRCGLSKFVIACLCFMGLGLAIMLPGIGLMTTYSFEIESGITLTGTILLLVGVTMIILGVIGCGVGICHSRRQEACVRPQYTPATPQPVVTGYTPPPLSLTKVAGQPSVVHGGYHSTSISAAYPGSPPSSPPCYNPDYYPTTPRRLSDSGASAPPPPYDDALMEYPDLR